MEQKADIVVLEVHNGGNGGHIDGYGVAWWHFGYIMVILGGQGSIEKRKTW